MSSSPISRRDLFRLAAAGKPLHHGYAERAALVDGEMADIIGNMPIVRAFGGIRREHRRFDDTVGQEMTARRRSLRYLEKLRLFHAGVTMILMVVLLAWAITLWQSGAATTGQVVLVCTLGFGILHATRDLAVVDHIGGHGRRHRGGAADQVDGHARIEDPRIEQRHAAHGLPVGAGRLS